VTGTVIRVDPVTGRTTATIHLTLPGPEIEGDRSFLPFSITSGTWVTESLAGVGFLAPAGGRLAIRPISDARQDVAVSGVAVGGGLVWAYGSFFNPASSRARAKPASSPPSIRGPAPSCASCGSPVRPARRRR
jgi:hypothetical protein